MIRSPERRRVLRVALLLTSGALSAACTAAGDRRAGVPGSGVESFHGRALLGGEYKRRESGDAEDLERALLRQEIELAIRGRIYDSRFLRYAGAVTLALNQTNISGDGQGFQNLFLPSYFGELRFLPKHRTPLSVWARRDEDRSIVESRASAPLVTTLSEELGASAAYRVRGFDGLVEFRRNLLETFGLDADRDQAQNSIIAKFRHTPSEGIDTRAAYIFETYREFFSAQDYETHTFTLWNKLRFGPLGPREGLGFTTRLDARDRTGTQNFTRVRFSELMRWWINKNFESRTRYDFSLFDTERDTRRHAFSQEFNHWLYKSLQTTPLAFISRENLDDGTIDMVGGGIKFDYQKKTSLGPLRIVYRYRFTRQENDLEDGVQQVLDEPHVLSTTTVSILQNMDVVAASVVVTDTAGTITYTQGFDYDLIPRGRLLEIVRVPGGIITDGQTVLVDYEYRTPKDLTFDTTTHGVFWDYYLFSVVRLYARYDRMRQDPVAGTVVAAALEDRDAVTVGSELTWRKLRFLGEYTDVDSTTAPYAQQRFEGGYNIQLRDGTRLGIAASSIRTQFPDRASQRNTVFQFRLQSRPTRGLSILFEPSYRIERGQTLDRDLLDARLDVRYRVGKLTFKWRVRHFTFVLPGPDTGETFTSFSMERRW